MQSQLSVPDEANERARILAVSRSHTFSEAHAHIASTHRHVSTMVMNFFTFLASWKIGARGMCKPAGVRIVWGLDILVGTPESYPTKYAMH